MNDPKVTRRGFLQGLAALTGAAFVGLPKQATAEPTIETMPAEPALLDAPITVDEPLCWLEINGQRYPLLDADVHVETEYLDVPRWGSSVSSAVPLLSRWEMWVEADGQAPVQEFLTMKKQVFRLRIPHGGLFEGNGYLSEMSNNFDGHFSWTAIISGDGQLVRV
jgi:hypothetical protein